MLLRRFFSPLVLVALLPLCGGCGGDAKKCAYGDPVPMFDKNLPTVTAHSFQPTGTQSVEEVSFSTGMDLEIMQEGCDNLRQEFRFTVEGNYADAPDSLWLKTAIRQFYFLAALGKKQKPLEMWGNAIEQAQGSFALGRPTEVAPDIAITVDKVVGRNESTLLVILENGASAASTQ